MNDLSIAVFVILSNLTSFLVGELAVPSCQESSLVLQ